ncbi:MAG: hypothetical protein WC346_07785 [Methanogenium sp.]|jgi:hypothetical protein
MNTKERKTSLETLKSQRVSELAKIEEARQRLVNEIIKLDGKIELLNELEKEETNVKESN